MSPPHEEPNTVLFDILQLPNELVIAVALFLPRHDLAALLWSSTHMRSLLAPLLYSDKELELVNAAKTWKPQLIELLIDRLGANPHETQSLDYNAGGNLLHTAISPVRALVGMKNDVTLLTKTVSLLISRGLDVNHRDSNRSTPLHYTVNDGHFRMNIAVREALAKVVVLLLDAGADGNATDMKGKTVMHHAARLNIVSIMQILLRRGVASEEVLDIYGNAPIHSALEGLLESGQVCKAVHVSEVVKNQRMDTLRVLCKEGKHINVRTKSGGYTALHRALKPSSMHHFCQGQYVFGRAIASLLLESGADPNVRDADGRCPIHIAAKKSDVTFIGLLTSSPKIELNSRTLNQFGDTALHYAIRYGGRECGCGEGTEACPRSTITKALLKSGLNVDEVTTAKETALHLAVGVGCKDSVEALLNYNARVDCVDIFGETVIHMAAETKLDDILRLLLKNANKEGKGRQLMEMKDGAGRGIWDCVHGKGKKKIVGILNDRYRSFETLTKEPSYPCDLN